MTKTTRYLLIVAAMVGAYLYSKQAANAPRRSSPHPTMGTRWDGYDPTDPMSVIS